MYLSLSETIREGGAIFLKVKVKEVNFDCLQAYSNFIHEAPTIILEYILRDGMLACRWELYGRLQLLPSSDNQFPMTFPRPWAYHFACLLWYYSADAVASPVEARFALALGYTRLYPFSPSSFHVGSVRTGWQDVKLIITWLQSTDPTMVLAWAPYSNTNNHVVSSNAVGYV